MNKLVFLIGVALLLTLGVALPAIAGNKGMGVSCKSSGECANGYYCKPNKAHLPGYFGTCQRK
jgi:hypothetical protein